MFRNNNQHSHTNEQHLPSWTQIKIPTTFGKKHHASIQCKGHIITHGGQGQRGTPGTPATFLMALDLKEQRQAQPGVRVLPKARTGHSMCLDKFDSIVVFGGFEANSVVCDKLEITTVKVRQGK